MADTGLVLATAAATIVVTYLLTQMYTGRVRRLFFSPIERGRTVIGLVILVIGAWTLLRSGVAWMILIAIFGIAFATTFVYFEEPHKEIR